MAMPVPKPRHIPIAVLSSLLLAACGGGDPPTAAPRLAAQLATGVAAATPSGATSGDRKSDRPPTAATETIALAPTRTPLVAATIGAPPAWPVWYGTGLPVAGIGCLTGAAYHKHALLSIYKDGVRLGLPDGIGRVHAGCYHAYEMHVHDVTGILHMEADGPRQFTLSQWFALWQQPLSRENTAGLAGPVRFYLIDDGAIARYDGDPGQIPILPHREILVVAGSVMTTVPNYLWPAGI